MKKILTIAALALLTLGGCNKNNENDENIETPPNAASTKTWKFGDQIWSDAIRIPDCDKSDFIYGNTTPDCRSYTAGSSKWYYYNKLYVEDNREKMCPSPWRLPYQDDFDELFTNITGTTIIGGWGAPGWFTETQGLNAYGISAGWWCLYEFTLFDILHWEAEGILIGIVNGVAVASIGVNNDAEVALTLRCVQ
jgi:hypothetical protein